MKSMKIQHLLGIALALVGAHALAEVPVERAIKYRQSAYFLMGQQFSQMNLMLKGDRPYDKASIELNAETLEVLSRIAFDAFPAGSDTGATKAKPEIWKQADKFKQLAQSAQGELVKLHAAAKAGDQQLIRQHFNDVRKSCAACHDQFKSK